MGKHLDGRLVHQPHHLDMLHSATRASSNPSGTAASQQAELPSIYLDCCHLKDRRQVMLAPTTHTSKEHGLLCCWCSCADSQQAYSTSKHRLMCRQSRGTTYTCVNPRDWPTVLKVQQAHGTALLSSCSLKLWCMCRIVHTESLATLSDGLELSRGQALHCSDVHWLHI